jgi:DNA-binding response OmpR family regulator
MATQCTLAGRRILVVEDEALIACTIEDHLEHAGVTVIGPATSVAEALMLLDGETTVDAAVLDVNLRGEKVFPIAAALRKRLIPFIFVTGYTSDEISPAYKDIPLLEKPTDNRELIAILASLISLTPSVCIENIYNIMPFI